MRKISEIIGEIRERKLRFGPRGPSLIYPFLRDFPGKEKSNKTLFFLTSRRIPFPQVKTKFSHRILDKPQKLGHEYLKQ